MIAQNPELDAVLDTMVDGVIMINSGGIVERYNMTCVQIFGYDAEQVIGKNISMLMPEPDRTLHDQYISNYQHTHDAKIIGIGREVKGRRKDGTIFPMYLSVGEMSGDQTVSFVGIIRDLTEESEQRVKFDALQHEHFHLSRVAAMDQMGAAIAHELNQPLTAIMNYLEAGLILLDQTTLDNDLPLKNIITQSTEQAERAAKILSRLRQFIETGHVDKKNEPIERIIQSALDLTLPAYRHQNINIISNIPKTLPMVWVSDVQIQQVLVNLIRNACEAMETAVNKCLTINAIHDPWGVVQVEVLDTGIGLDAQQVQKLYEPFSSNKKGGLGVGLSISQSIISNHDGRLWAEKAEPHGTGFYFTLPVAARA